MSQRPPTRYWWVNHKYSAAPQLTGDYLRASERDRNGSRNESFHNLTRVQPGDLVFAFADGAVRAVGIALRSAIEAPAPAQRQWHLPVRYLQLQVPLNPKAHMLKLKQVLPRSHAPLRPTGLRNPAVYLACVSDAMSAVLRQLLDEQLEDIEAQINAAVGSELADDWIETAIQRRTDISSVDRQQLIRARHGQGVYRRNLEKIENACRVTGLLDRRHLRATHIKPWSASEDSEKLDGCNGLLLSPHIAHLFARGYISFADDGELLLSRHLNPAVLKSWTVRPSLTVGKFQPQQCQYLEYHRREVFDRAEIGRRAAHYAGAG
jgi:putative restriction endonuclease